MKLVIVESPAKAKTIRKYLGEDFEVLPSVGHIRDLPSSERDAIDMENGFAPNYTVLEGKEKVIGQIIEVSERSSKVFLATDPDREGESIAWHIKEVAGIKNAKRIVFNEITEDAVKKALRSPRDIDENLKEAQETRRVLDRLFGYTLSKLIWQKVRYGLSAGRVQSPALRILMERERERRKFNPVSFWNIKATLKDAHGFIYEAVDENNIAKRQDAEEMVKKGKNAKWIVESILECPRKRSANPPFITSTLQQVSNTRLNYSPANTMRIAQKLYEDGHITYMRTDSARISDQFQVQLKAFIEKEFGETEYQKNEFKKKSKIAQDAHEAVRPTDIKKKSAGSTDDQKKLYGLIWSRTSASHMKDAETLSTTIKFTAKDEKIPDLIMRGNKIKYLGWLAADPGGKGEETVLPDIDKDGVFSCESIEHIEKETEPPHRYSEAGLVKELEKRGIGRPSTYAATIKTLVDRVYVEKEGRTLVPTDTGDVVSTFLEKHFKAYIADKFTADMEDELDAISVGKQNYKSFLTDFYYPFFDSVDKKRNIEKLTTLGKAPEKYRCPDCNSRMEMKLSKNGTFMSCARFPDCKGARTKEGEEIKEKLLGMKCPKCEKGEMVSKMGKFGVFNSCNGYPKCKYVEENAEEKEKARTGVECPECRKGEIIERKGRFGVFYGCEKYPSCKFTIRAKPTKNNCNICSSIMMEGTKTIPERCSVKTCPMHRPDKLKKI